MGAIYSVPFSAVAVTAAQDVFELTTSANTRAKIREIRLGQYSDFGDAQAEIISVKIITGYTVSGSGGSTVTPVNLNRIASGTASDCVAEANNTTVANTGTGTVVLADVFNVAAGWWYYPPEEERINMDISQRLVVRITAPADSLTMNGTLIFEETGKGG